MKKFDDKQYFTYLLRCQDGSLYFGITTDLLRRMSEHFSAGEKSAKYTRSHRAVRLERAWLSADRAAASRLEYRAKRLTKAQKEQLVTTGDFGVFAGKLLPGDYVPVDIASCAGEYCG